MTSMSNRDDDGGGSPTLTQLEFRQSDSGEDDFDVAEAIARRMGFTQTVYTSCSMLWGLYCLPDRASQRHGVVIKTRELGFLFVSSLEDLQMHDLWDAYVRREYGASPRERTAAERTAARDKAKAKPLSKSKEEP